MNDVIANKRDHIARMERTHSTIRSALVELLDTAEFEGRPLTESEETIFEELESEALELSRDIQWMRETLEIDEQHAATMRRIGVPAVRYGE